MAKAKWVAVWASLTAAVVLGGCADDGTTEGAPSADTTAGEAGDGDDASGAEGPEEDAAGESDVAPEPDTPDPDTTEPDTAEPDTGEPDARAPEDTQGDVPDTRGDVEDTPSPDTSDPDASDARTTADTTDMDSDEEPDVPPPPPLTADILAPTTGSFYQLGDPVELIGQIGGGGVDPTELQAQWLANGVALGEPLAPGPDGSIVLLTSELPAGQNIVTLEATLAGFETAEDGIAVFVCEPLALTFDTDVVDEGWKIYGDAVWDPSGWLELTGNAQDRAGSIYLIEDKIFPGDVSFTLSIYTGDGINTGADGFAMNIFDVETVEELDAVVDSAANGGCLGYGVGGECGPMEVTSFHIEFDTWQNDGNPVFDPTPQNHIAVTLNGDPSNHVLWAAVPTLEDSIWHDVSVNVVGSNILVTVDGVEVIDESVPGFLFKGGYLGFSGSTGWATNFHRIDNLDVKQTCIE